MNVNEIITQKKSISPNGKYYAYLAPLDGKINIWVSSVDKQDEPRYLIKDKDFTELSDVFWCGGAHIYFTQRSNKELPWIYAVNLETGEEPLKVVEKHDYEQLVALMIPMVKEFYHNIELQKEMLEYLSGWPEINDPLAKVDAQECFRFYNELSDEEKEEYLYSMCWTFVGRKIIVTSNEAEKWQNPYDYFMKTVWPAITKRRVAKIREINPPSVWHIDVPKEIIPRGTKAAAMIQQTILRAFEDRYLSSKKQELLTMLVGRREAYLFPSKEDKDDVLWVSYEHHNCEISAGFGRTDLQMSFSFGFPWAANYSHYQLISFAELEIVINQLCLLLEFVYPYHKGFFDDYSCYREVRRGKL